MKGFGLSGQQKQLLSLAKLRGFVTIQEGLAVYTDPVNLRWSFRKLVGLGLLRVSAVPNRFEYVGGERE